MKVEPGVVAPGAVFQSVSSEAGEEVTIEPGKNEGGSASGR
jgi:hypothetical protein